MDHLFDFTIYEKYALFLSYPELHKSFIEVGKTEGRYCPGEDNKS
jgi:hypothetical protein